MKFQTADVGKEVVLAANEEEGWAEERGTLIEVEPKGMLIIRIEDEFLQDDGDDGIREVHEDYVTLGELK